MGADILYHQKKMPISLMNYQKMSLRILDQPEEKIVSPQKRLF